MEIGIIGLGTMGQGIAQVFATAGYEIMLYDTFEGATQKAKLSIEKSLEQLVQKSKLSTTEAKIIESKFHWKSNLNEFYSCELIIEAIKEDFSLKKELFGQLNKIISDTCIVATNTSSLSITALASTVLFPDRFIGVHFFNPATIMPLVEVIPAIQTSQKTIDTVKQILLKSKKVIVQAIDTPGFIVNRLARPFYGEAIKMYEEGIADIETIDWAMTEIGGFKMGPFTLMDFIGHDINYAVTESIFNAFYYDSRYKPSFTQKRLLEAGFLGRKSGRGFYQYHNSEIKSTPNKDFTLGKNIVNQILVMLINEAAEALLLQVATKEDLELAMTKGVNYPKGLLTWADEIGIQNCVNQLDELFNKYHDTRYRCCVLLREYATKNMTFFQ